ERGWPLTLNLLDIARRNAFAVARRFGYGEAPEDLIGRAYEKAREAVGVREDEAYVGASAYRGAMEEYFNLHDWKRGSGNSRGSADRVPFVEKLHGGSYTVEMMQLDLDEEELTYAGLRLRGASVRTVRAAME